MLMVGLEVILVGRDKMMMMMIKNRGRREVFV